MIKRCILIALGLEMLLVSLLLCAVAADPRGDMDGASRPFPWAEFGKNMLIASPVIAIGIGLIVYNFKSLVIENAVEEKGRRLRLWLIQFGLIIVFVFIPWTVLGTIQRIIH